MKKRRIDDPVIQKALRSEEAKAKRKAVASSIIGDPNSLASQLASPPSTFTQQPRQINPITAVPSDFEDVEDDYPTLRFVGTISRQGKNRIIYIPTYIVKNMKLPIPVGKKLRITVMLDTI